MDGYIDREELMKFPIRHNHYDKEHGNKHFIYGIETVLEYAENLPAADVAPVRHGRWIMKKTSAGASYTICSHCNASVKYNDEYGTAIMNLKGANYCPNCGAKMDGSSNEE